MITLSLKMCGALVFTAPRDGSPFLTDHTTFPDLASSATSVLSACCRNTLPSAYATPRFTVSQHICGMTAGSCFGSYFHLMVWVFRSIANTLFGKALWIYIMSPITSGEPS